MAAIGSIAAPIWVSISTPTKSKSRFSFPLNKTQNSFTLFSTFPSHSSFVSSNCRLRSLFSPRAASSSSAVNAEYIEEPTTNVKFQRSLNLPGCSESLSLLGTGFREKVFAIIGVKVYAAGLYVNESIFNQLDAWRGRKAADMQNDSSLFETIFKVPTEKALSIILVRDVDGKTFWDALDEAISPRIKSPSPDDETALSTFRSLFQGRPLKKGTFIALTWIDQTKMLVCVSPGATPSSIDATIESKNVTSALFDVFLGGTPVSPSLKQSVANGLEVVLK